MEQDIKQIIFDSMSEELRQFICNKQNENEAREICMELMDVRKYNISERHLEGVIDMVIDHVLYISDCMESALVENIAWELEYYEEKEDEE